MNSDSWAPDSWRKKAVSQQPQYSDQDLLQRTLERLSVMPPLVTSWEVENLKSQLAAASQRQAFLLQGGDCSEQMDDCSADAIVRNLKVLMQMSFVLTYASMSRIIRVGRLAGQYAKPRSADTETRDGVTLPVYRGDNINRSGFTAADRNPDPELLIRGYQRSALTLNFIRGLSAGGFGDLHHPENWDLEFARDSPFSQPYHTMVDSITNSLQFMETILDRSIADSKSVEIFTSHEGLHLSYEQAQTRHVPRREGWYNLSTHLPWIGNRTRAIDGAHIEYFRGIENPVGIKVGNDMTPDELIELVDVINPSNRAGRIVLIHRMGAENISKYLPPLVSAIEAADKVVLWCADPMHGNTYATAKGTKTRSFDQILKELSLAFEIHRDAGSYLGGVHLELTGDNVTECIGGPRDLTESDLVTKYRSTVDPRLNYDQSMEIAFLVADHISRQK